jgi:hypothetical protein
MARRKRILSRSVRCRQTNPVEHAFRCAEAQHGGDTILGKICKRQLVRLAEHAAHCVEFVHQAVELHEMIGARLGVIDLAAGASDARCGVVTFVVGDHRDDLRALRHRAHLPPLPHGKAHRLFDQDVQPGLGGSDRNRRVAARGENEERIERLRLQVAPITSFCVRPIGPRRLIAGTRSMKSGVFFRNGWLRSQPAALARMSMRPCRFQHAGAQASTDTRSARSSTVYSIASPAAFASVSIAAAPSRLMSATILRASAGELQGGGLANPGNASGYQGSFVVEPHTPLLESNSAIQ